MSHLPVVVGVTGASGALYAKRTLSALAAAGREVHVVVSPSARLVFRTELGVAVDVSSNNLAKALGVEGAVREWRCDNLAARIASGSFLTSGMVIVPCSMSTLAAVAHGQGVNLIHRAADVHLKERRKLIVVPRETPLSLVAIENMARLTRAGGVVLPAMPGFYHGAKTVDDLVDFIVARICDQLGVENQLIRRWGGRGPERPIDDATDDPAT